eukprot:NODE_136_length_18060_cov_0.656645.p11 type:complete len:167 gc:universal NODE_136_length_18060_cov_0.656645:2565-3065(+)
MSQIASLYQVKTATPCNEPSFTKFIEATMISSANCSSYVDSSCKQGFTYKYTCVEKSKDINLGSAKYTRKCKFENSTEPYYIKQIRLSSSCELTEDFQYLKNQCTNSGISESYFSDSACSQPLNNYNTDWNDPNFPNCELSCELTSGSANITIMFVLWVLMSLHVI